MCLSCGGVVFEMAMALATGNPLAPPGGGISMRRPSLNPFGKEDLHLIQWSKFRQAAGDAYYAEFERPQNVYGAGACEG